VSIRAAVIFFLAIVVLGGLARLAIPTAAYQPVGAQQADIWTRCLPSVAIASGNVVAVSALPPAAGGAASTELSVIFSETGQPAVSPEGASSSELQIRRGDGEVWWDGRTPLIVETDGGRFLLPAGRPVGFQLAEGEKYPTRLASQEQRSAAAASGVRSSTTRLLSVGENEAVRLAPLRTLLVKPWLYDEPAELSFARAFGQNGPTSVVIRASRSELDPTELRACYLSEGASSARRAAVSGAEPIPDFGTAVLLGLPASALQEWRLLSSLQIAVANLDGTYAAAGNMTEIGRGWAALISTAVAAGLFWLLATSRQQNAKFDSEDWSRWFAGLFIGGDNDPSLSLFQIYFWTFVIVWGFVYCFVVAGALLVLTADVMALLGIAGTGAVLARWIAGQSGGSTSKPAATVYELKGVGVAHNQEAFGFWQIFSTDGRFDLLKMQVFLFTILVGVYVVWRIAATAAFPALDPNILLLLGISQSVYIGGKFTDSRPLTRLNQKALDIMLNQKAKEDLLALKRKLDDEVERLGQSKKELHEEEASAELAEDRKSAIAFKLSEIERHINQKIAEIKDLNSEVARVDRRISELQVECRSMMKEAGLIDGGSGTS
jgi:hypothetical protein